MSRPQIIVNVTAALARRGAATATGRAFIAYPTLVGAPVGPTVPIIVKSEAEALAAAVPAATATLIGDVLRIGAPDVVVVRATAVNVATPTEPELTAALSKFSGDYGPGQVMVPGIAMAAAHTALLTHANLTGRTVMLDHVSTVTSSAFVASVTALAASPGAKTAGAPVPWVKMPLTGGGTREIPGSIIAAGLAARGDAFAGHANNAPAGDQGRGAGFIDGATDVTVAYTDAELDSIHDAGGSAIRNILGDVQLFGWNSISTDARFGQLNAGRMAMQLASGIRAGAAAFLFKQIDGRGLLFAELEGFLRGYLQPLWAASALYGETADDAFDVNVADANTPATTTAGELRADVEVTLTPHAEKVIIAVVTSSPEGA